MDAAKEFLCNMFLRDRPKLLIRHHALKDVIVAFHSLDE